MSANDSQIPLILDDDDQDFSRKKKKTALRNKKQTKNDESKGFDSVKRSNSN